jgi:hypothetical protein
MLNDIMNIKNGNYVDEGDMVEISNKNSNNKYYSDHE